MEHHFNINIAKTYGIEEAILLHHFYFWIAKNAANDRHFHDGLYWTYNSKKAYADFFVYMNETKIFRVIKHLEDEKIITKGNFNTDKWDKTNWYAITKKGLVFLKDNGYDMKSFSASLQNDVLDCVKMNDGVCQNEQSIIINNTNKNNTNNNNKKEKELKEKFSTFVSLYKKAGGKVRGVDTEFNEFTKRHKDWRLVIPYLELALQRETMERNQAKIDKKFYAEIKNLRTYLGKQRAWEMYVTVGEELDDERYTPQGRSIWFDESTKSYWTDDNFYYGVISDGYTDEDRPDGATLTMSNARGIITWNSSTKKWENK